MKYKVKRSKTGLGLFATESIPKKIFIIEYVGNRVLNTEYDEYTVKHPNLYMFELDDTWTIDGSSRKNLARYINHSCKPNSEIITDNDKIEIYSAKLIKAGEEITIDYGSDYFNEHIKPKGCKCSKCMNV